MPKIAPECLGQTSTRSSSKHGAVTNHKMLKKLAEVIMLGFSEIKNGPKESTKLFNTHIHNLRSTNVSNI